MNLESVKIDFENFINQHTLKVEGLTLAKGVQLMLDFYKRFRVDDCPIDKNGDMLLFDWGMYDWGDGLFFQCDISRQFISNGLLDDDAISQLSVGFYFDPLTEFNNLKLGSHWCESLDEIISFEMFILKNDAYLSVATKQPVKVILNYSQV